MKSFKLLLEEFDKVLKEYNLQNYNKLKPPLLLAEINTCFDKLNINDESLHLLYEWKDGFDAYNRPNEVCSIMKFDTFYSLESVKQLINYYSDGEVWPGNSFIPIINDGCGSFIMFNNKPGIDYGKLCLYSPSLLFVEPITYYDSVYTMVETTIEAYKQEIFVYDQAIYFLDVDIDRFHEIGKKINKHSKYWTHKH